MHGIPWILCGHHGMWASVCRKTLWVLESTDRCSVQCSKGAAVRDDLAGGEVSQRLAHVLQGNFRQVLLVR
jgi:hypothetical protein